MTTDALNLKTLAYNSSNKESNINDSLYSLENGTQRCLDIELNEPPITTPGTNISSNNWRLYFFGVQGNITTTIRVAEIIMAATAGGPTQCVGGIANSSTTFGVNGPERAFDNTPSTFWETATSCTYDWISYNFTTPVIITEIRIQGSTSAANSPLFATLQYSPDNGVSWISYCLLNLNSGWTSGLVKTFAIQNQVDMIRTQFPPRFWRALATEVFTGTGVTLADLQFFDTVGGPNNISGGYFINGFASNRVSYPLSNAFDNSSTSLAQTSLTNPDRAFFGYIYPSGVTNVEAKILGANTLLNSHIKSLSIDYSRDGVSWVSVNTTVNMPPWTSSEVRTFTLRPLNAGDKTLSEEEFTRYFAYRCNPVVGTRFLNVKPNSRVFCVKNDGVGTVKVTASNSLDLLPGETVLYKNNNNTLEVLLKNTNNKTFIGNIDSPTDYINSGLKELVVNTTNDGIIFGLKHNFNATTNPTNLSDSSQQYSSGSMWFNSANNTLWFCKNASIGSAVWILYINNEVLHAGYNTTGNSPTLNFNSSGTGVANVLKLYPIQIFKRININKLFVNVRTAGSGDSEIKLALWRNNYNTGLPTGLPVAGNNTGLSTSTIGLKASTVSFLADPEIYWIGSVIGGTTIANFNSNNAAHTEFCNMFGATVSQSRAMSGAGNNGTHCLTYAFSYTGNITTLDLTGASFVAEGGSVTSTPHIGFGW